MLDATSRSISSAYRKPHTCWQHHAALPGGTPYSKPARTTTHRIPRILVAGLLVVIAAIAAALGYRSLAASSSSATSPIAAQPLAHRPHDSLNGDHHGAIGEADGVVPDGVTVFDD